MKRAFFITVALIVCSAVICLAALENIGGNWIGETIGPEGRDYKLRYEFKLDAGKLFGAVKSDDDVHQINNGKVQGDNITFDIEIENGDTVYHHGRYYSIGDSISMNIDHDGSKMHVTLQRAEK